MLTQDQCVAERAIAKMGAHIAVLGQKFELERLEEKLRLLSEDDGQAKLLAWIKEEKGELRSQMRENLVEAELAINDLPANVTFNTLMKRRLESHLISSKP